jgi:hypothetical protein
VTARRCCYFIGQLAIITLNGLWGCFLLTKTCPYTAKPNSHVVFTYRPTSNRGSSCLFSSRLVSKPFYNESCIEDCLSLRGCRCMYVTYQLVTQNIGQHEPKGRGGLPDMLCSSIHISRGRKLCAVSVESGQVWAKGRHRFKHAHGPCANPPTGLEDKMRSCSTPEHRISAATSSRGVLLRVT